MNLLQREKSINERLLNICFYLSFNTKLSKENQDKIKAIEIELNDLYDKLDKTPVKV